MSVTRCSTRYAGIKNHALEGTVTAMQASGVVIEIHSPAFGRTLNIFAPAVKAEGLAFGEAYTSYCNTPSGTGAIKSGFRCHRHLGGSVEPAPRP